MSKSKKKRVTQRTRRKHRTLIEGMARCVSNDGMVKELRVGEVYYVREIPNMRGHCVVLRNKGTPLVGYHLDRFTLLEEHET